jgi:hypothetical protein
MKLWAKAIPLHVTPKVLPSSGATQIIRVTEAEKAAKEAAGHDDEKTTADHYDGVDDTYTAEAMERACAPQAHPVPNPRAPLSLTPPPIVLDGRKYAPTLH